MKSVPFTSRGPVDDTNFSWLETQPRLYQSKGELGLRGLRHSASHPTPHRRSHTTGSVASSSIHGDSSVLPKIATGRSVYSAKLMWKDHENIKIKNYIQNELETPKMPPLYVPKNPKPLYKRPVDEWKQFNILHFREFAENDEIEPNDVTDCSEFYSQITFLRNAVRNIDGTTSYQNLCKKPRSWSEPSVVDDQPGLIKGNRLHWQSASLSLPHPRMLLPLKPGPTTKWYAWRNAVQSNMDKDKHKSKRKNRKDRHFIEAFTPRNVPNPTPATLKAPRTTEDSRKPENQTLLRIPDAGTPSSTPRPATTPKQDADRQGNEESKVVETNGLTFITESKEESVDKTENKDEQQIASQDTHHDETSPAHEQVNNADESRDKMENEQSEGAKEGSEEPRADGDPADKTGAEDTNTPQDGDDGVNKESNDVKENNSPADEQEGDENIEQSVLDQDYEHPKEQETANKDEKEEVNEDPSQGNVGADDEANKDGLDSKEDGDRQPAPADDIIQEESSHVDQSKDQLTNETPGATPLPNETEDAVIPAGTGDE